MVLAKGEKVVVAGDQPIGLGNDGGRDDEVVIRVAAVRCSRACRRSSAGSPPRS
jgi:hypothetical protein